MRTQKPVPYPQSPKRQPLFLSCLFVLVVALLGALMPLPQAFAAENSTSSSPAAITSKESTKTPASKTYTVTFVYYDNTTKTVTQKVVIVNAGQCVSKPKDPWVPPGQTFEGWFTEPGVYFDFSTPITCDITLHARDWTPLVPPPNPSLPVFVIIATFNSQGGTTVKAGFCAPGDTLVRPKDPTKTGYKFLGWYTKEGKKWDFSHPVTIPITLYARWEKLPASSPLPPTSDSGALIIPVALLGGLGTAGVLALRRRRHLLEG